MASTFVIDTDQYLTIRVVSVSALISTTSVQLIIRYRVATTWFPSCFQTRSPCFKFRATARNRVVPSFWFNFLLSFLSSLLLKREINSLKRKNSDRVKSRLNLRKENNNDWSKGYGRADCWPAFTEFHQIDLHRNEHANCFPWLPSSNVAI